MDGNRRWAKAKGKVSHEGHNAGFTALKNLINSFDELKSKYGVSEYIFYAFSTENWNRSEAEVAHLMDLFAHAFDELRAQNEKRGKPLRIIFLGDRTRLRADLVEQMNKIESETKGNGEGKIAFAVSYGGRDEIMRAFKKADSADLSEESFAKCLDTNELRDPDLIIRTGGEHRLSNFLLWQGAYSELFFVDTLWPDFNAEHFGQILDEYNERERRHGK